MDEEIPSGEDLCFSTRKVIYVILTISVRCLSHLISTIKDVSAADYSFTEKEKM